VILQGEESDRRFERFCVDLFSEVDALEYSTTSANYDHGKDGRYIGQRLGQGRAFICSSLQKTKLLDKAGSDFDKLLQHTTVARVRFCFGHDVTEKLADDIEAMVRKKHPEIDDVHTEGLEQFVGFCRRHPEPFERYYKGEIDALQKAALTETTDGAVKVNGMRIALTTQLNADAATLRAEVTRNLVLTVLEDGRPRNLHELAVAISEQLFLPATVREQYLLSTLNELAVLSQIERDPRRQDMYRLAPAGSAELRRRVDEGTRNLLEGRKVVRRTLAQRVEGELPEAHFRAVWQVTQDGLANMFLSEGLRITECIATIARGDRVAAETSQLDDGLRALCDRIRRLDFPSAAAIADALPKLFTDRTTATFEWLTGLCVAYLTMCSLGLEPEAQDQVLARLRKWEVLLDTHVVLAMLSKGEPDHAEVTTIMEGWRAIGGRLLVPEPVLEEAAYHAKISEDAYRAFWQTYRHRGSARADIPREVLLGCTGNVFVRGFIVESKGGYYPGKWRTYIANFRAADFGWSRILRVLREDHGTDAVRDGGQVTGLAKRVSDQLMERRGGGDDDAYKESLLYRCAWDGRLVALLIQRRGELETTDANAVVISSAGWLRRVCEDYRRELGSRTPVISVSALAYTLALAPNVKMSLGTLRGVFFSGRLAKALPRLQTVIGQVYRRQRRKSLDLARGPTLADAMDKSIADVSGHPPKT